MDGVIACAEGNNQCAATGLVFLLAGIGQGSRAILEVIWAAYRFGMIVLLPGCVGTGRKFGELLSIMVGIFVRPPCWIGRENAKPSPQPADDRFSSVQKGPPGTGRVVVIRS